MKYGESTREAFAHWKSLYNQSQILLYCSFIICALKTFDFPVVESFGFTIFRLFIGGALLLIHMWSSLEVYEVIGDLGWFYGDFFISNYLSKAPRYTGIYRYLNNPEKVIGQGAFWGFALISYSLPCFLLALFGQFSTFLLVQYVEKPHMRKLYGDSLREKGGVESLLSREVGRIISSAALKKLVQAWEDAVSPIASDCDSTVAQSTDDDSEPDSPVKVVASTMQMVLGTIQVGYEATSF